MWKRGKAFSRVIQKYKSIQNPQTLKRYIFHILQYFTSKLHNFTKFRKLFPTVLKLFSNLKVCLIGEWSIPHISSVSSMALAINNGLLSIRLEDYNFLTRDGNNIGATKTMHNRRCRYWRLQRYCLLFLFRSKTCQFFCSNVP